MSSGNVIPFPAGNGGNRPFGLPPVASASSTPSPEPADPRAVDVQPAQPQQAAAGPSTQAANALQARFTSTLNLARKASKKLIDSAVPGTVELGLFNQYGIIQNELAQLFARAAQASDDNTLMAVGQDLERVEKETNDFVTAVDTALANAPIPTQSSLVGGNPYFWWYVGGGLGALALSIGAWMYLRKPTRRRKLMGLFSAGGPAATPVKPPSKRRKLKRK
jgi:hypothetical protein